MDEGRIVWDKAEFVPDAEGLASSHADIALTLMVKETHTVVSWQVNVNEATLPVAEGIARTVAELIRAHFDEQGYRYTTERE